MKTKSLKNNKGRIVLLLVLLAIFLCYVSQLTHSGLWQDEAVEYFYSKYLGPLPENMLVNSGGNNMYERICSTFQPPLYNVLMYFWLLLFDSEVSFRLAGVLVTFVGAIGFYKSVKAVSNFLWASCGVVVYLTTNSVMYYGLECAEYNLLLCMESWALFYFVKFLKGTDFKHQRNSMIGFFAFAVLAAYSQYGSILLMFPLAVVMLVSTVRKGDRKLLATMIAAGFAVIVFFGVPLLYFFLIHQMENQHSIGISHSPVFIQNLFYSVFYGVKCLIDFNFGSSLLRYIFVIFIGILSLLGLCNRNKLLATFWITTVAVYLLYFILVACSFYAYNAWSGALGCNNFYMGRYTLYMIPFILLTLIYGLSNFNEYICEKGKYDKILRYCLCGIMLIFVSLGIKSLTFTGWQKGNVREVYNVWEASDGAKNVTVVHNFINQIFVYYFMHSRLYNAETKKNVIGESFWDKKTTPEEVYQKLDSIGIYKHNVVNVVTPNETLCHYDTAMKKAGYSPKYILDGREHGDTSLIVYSR